MAQVSLEGSRLVRFLSDLGVSNVALFDKGFAEKISQLIGFQDSIALSGLHGQLSRLKFERLPVAAEAVQQEFLQVRQALVTSIVDSFTPGSGNARGQFPGTREGATPEQLVAIEPYLQFYTARQREIELKYQYLLSYVRDAANGFSPRLAQLVMLEASLGDILAPYGRQQFAVIPKLLKDHFDELREAAGETDQLEEAETPPAWIRQFGDDVRGLLLAELELRLLPVQGLIEAFAEEPDRQSD